MTEETSFIAHSTSTDLTLDVTASLDLKGATLDTYYFNKENTLGYTRNWFNYTKFQSVHPETIISEVVQYARPAMVAAALDTSKTFAVGSTTLTAEWAARTENTSTASTTPALGLCGLDGSNNLYVIDNYTKAPADPSGSGAAAYNANNTLFGTALNNGVPGASTVLTKYNTSGSVIWLSRIRTLVAGGNTMASACVTDLLGNTYISGTGNGVVIFENSVGSTVISVDVTGKTYLVAYNPNGVPLWVTYVSGDYTGGTKTRRTTLAVDNQLIGHVFMLFENELNVGIDFYDNVPSAPGISLTIPQSDQPRVILAKYGASGGLFQWATFVSGYRVGLSSFQSETTQAVACDLDGNVAIVGNYTQIDQVVDAVAPSEDVPVFAQTTTSVPPYASPVVWVPRDNDREWSAVDVEPTGRYMIASESGGYLYVSTNFGTSWDERASIQNWSGVFCGLEGTVFVACVYQSAIYRSINGGTDWITTSVEGSVARKWVALAGNATGSRLIAAAENDRLYQSSDYGASWYPSQTFLSSGALTLNAGENQLFTSVLDNSEQYAFFTTSTSPTKVVKVDLTALPDPTRIGVLTLNAGENVVRAAVRYSSGVNQRVFYGTTTTPGRIVQVDLDPALPTRVNALTLHDFPIDGTANGSLLCGGVVDPLGQYAYYGTNAFDVGGSPYVYFVRVNLQTSSGPFIDKVIPSAVPMSLTQCALMDPAGAYVYFVNTYFNPPAFGQITRINLSTFTITGTLNLAVGEQDPGCAVIDPAGVYGYIGVANQIVKVNLTTATPTRVATLVLAPTENNPRCAVMDATGAFAYFGTDCVGGLGGIVKINLSTFTRVGVVAAGTYPLVSAFRSPTSNFAYFMDYQGGLYVGTNTVYKLNLSTFTNVGALNIPCYGYGSVVNSTGQYAYFSSDGQIDQVNLSTFTHAATFSSVGNNDSTSFLYNPTTQHLYGTYSPEYAVLLAINLSGAPVYATYLFNDFEDNLSCGVRTPGGIGFFGCNTPNSTTLTTPTIRKGSRVVKVDLNTNQPLGSFNLYEDECFLSCAVIDPTGQYAYFGTNTSPGQIIKIDTTAPINPPDYTQTPYRVGKLTLGTGQNNVSCALVDPFGQFAYFGLNTSPAIIIKVNLATFTVYDTLSFNPGEDAVFAAAMDPSGQYAYFGTGTSPGIIVWVALSTFTRVDSTLLSPGQNNLQCASITTDRKVVFGTDTSPGQVIRAEILNTSPVANWCDVAYDVSSNTWMALIRGGQAYRSDDNGYSWSLCGASPVANWTAIGASRFAASPLSFPYAFYAVVDGGKVYGVNALGTTWTILENTNRAYSDVATTGGLRPMNFASVLDGPILQSIYETDTDMVWFPTTIPRNWNNVALTSTNGVIYGVASVRGGQLYVTTNPYPRLHTFVVKYDSFGVVQWTNYVNCQTSNEGDNTGNTLACKTNGEIVVAGVYDRAIDFFSASDLNTPVKTLTTTASGNGGVTGYLVDYSSDGIPIWVNHIVCTPYPAGPNFGALSALIPARCLQIDGYGNVYTWGNAYGTDLYNPDGTVALSATEATLILVKYYANGYLQSYTRVKDTSSYQLICGAIRVPANGSKIFFTGENRQVSNSVDAYNSLGVTVGTTETFGAFKGIIVGAYTMSTASSGALTIPVYNSPFEPLLTIGGGNRYLVGRYTADNTAEPWGGQTGLEPSAITLADANAAVISYLGHQPGYSIPTVDGLPETSDFNLTKLVVQLSEPSFPLNDPQPVGPGTVPYGFLPIYITVPAYATQLRFNTNAYHANLECVAVGTLTTSGLVFGGVVVGDVIRVLVSNTLTSRYTTLQVKALVASNTATGTYASIVFEEPSRYLINVLERIEYAYGVIVRANGTQYLPAFYQPIVIEQGQLNLILQLYPEAYE